MSRENLVKEEPVVTCRGGAFKNGARFKGLLASSAPTAAPPELVASREEELE